MYEGGVQLDAAEGSFPSPVHSSLSACRRGRMPGGRFGRSRSPRVVPLPPPFRKPSEGQYTCCEYGVK